jgi:hypothetical protein
MHEVKLLVKVGRVCPSAPPRVKNALLVGWGGVVRTPRPTFPHHFFQSATRAWKSASSR